MKCGCRLIIFVISLFFVLAAWCLGVVSMFVASGNYDRVKNLYWFRQPTKAGYMYYNAKNACQAGVCHEYSDTSNGPTDASTAQEAVIVFVYIGFSALSTVLVTMPCFLMKKLANVQFGCTIF